MKLGMDEDPLQVLLFFGQIRPGTDPGQAKKGHGGPLLQETSSSDRKATATNRMHSSDLETCGSVVIFGSIRKSNFWRVFDVFLDLVKFALFNAISIDFYAWWILMKLGMDEELKVPYKCCCFSARSVQGRIQGRAKKGHGGSPSSGNFFFRPEGYSNKPNA